MILKYGMTGTQILIRALIALFIWKDMTKRNMQPNYYILALTLFQEYWGVAFYLLSYYFESYSSNNKTFNAETN